VTSDQTVLVNDSMRPRTESSHHREQIARVATEVLAPAPVAAGLLAVVSWQSAASLEDALAWAVVASLFASLIPISYVLREIRKHRFSNRHVPVREQRRAPLLVALASVTVGLLTINAMGAPRPLVALIAAMLAGLAVSLVVTLFWKMSIHTAVVSGSVVILAFVFGPVLLLTAPLVALVAWSRVELGDHTFAQVAGGAGLGALVALTTYPLLLG
jgi:membrane-associated phospholipid phosphatase